MRKSISHYYTLVYNFFLLNTMLDVPFVPDIEKIYDAFDSSIGVAFEDVDESDYLMALRNLKIIEKGPENYECASEWKTLASCPHGEKDQCFERCLLKLPLSQSILKYIGDTGKSEKEIIDSTSSEANETCVKSFLVWMEKLGVLELKNGMYLLGNNREEDDSDSHDSSKNPLTDFAIHPDTNSVFEYLRRIKRGAIQLNPDFQRKLVWKDDQKSKFIESALMNLPLPPIYLKKNSDTNYVVIDGLQRSSALRDFMDGKFKLSDLKSLPELNGCYFDDLDGKQDGLCARLEDRQLFLFVLPPSCEMSVVYDIFERINTGGTQLSRQEVRNCIYHGQSTKLLKEVSENRIFRDSIGYGISPTRMKDREAVLRCLSFAIQGYESYDGFMERFLEKTMAKINKMTNEEVDFLRQKTLDTFALTYRLFGYGNFRIPSYAIKGRINIAVMESVFFYFFNRVDVNDQYAKTKFIQLINDEEYQTAVRWTTSSKNQVTKRFKLVKQYFDVV